MMKQRNAKKTMISMISIILAACSDSGDELLAPENSTAYIIFGSSSKSGGIEWVDGRVGTRTRESNATDKEIEASIPDNIGVFAFGDGANITYVFKNQKVYYKKGEGIKQSVLYNKWNFQEYLLDADGNILNDNNGPRTQENLWPYTTQEGSNAQTPWQKMHYRFFAYSPWSSDTDVKVTAENYAGFNAFEWQNIPGFTAEDYMLAHEIVPVNNSGKDGNDTKPFRETPDAVHFQMRHILSRIRFFFKMSPEYRTIRKIELNSLTVLTAGKVKTATFNFNNNSSWDGTVHWSNEQIGDAEPVELFSQTGQEYMIEALGKDPGTNKELYPTDPFTSVYVYPQDNFNELKIKVNYTVYDSEGVVTRNAEVTNTIEVKPAWNLESGYYYDIKINIVPDYLYVLSDNDQDFDGYVIIKDQSGNP